jgi:deoxycytidylate deaminase
MDENGYVWGTMRSEDPLRELLEGKQAYDEGRRGDEDWFGEKERKANTERAKEYARALHAPSNSIYSTFKKYCPFCGAENNNLVIFCEKCGKQIG